MTGQDFPFVEWQDLTDADRPFLMDDSSSEWLTYGEAKQRIDQLRPYFQGEKALVFLYLNNTIPSALAFFAAISSGQAVALLDCALPASTRQALTETYTPEFVFEPDIEEIPRRLISCGSAISSKLGILLSTSGSTGSPKFVRLTYEAVLANAHSIALALEIDQSDVACGHLPLHYSFGMSTLTAHTSKGARIRLTQMSFMDRSFWTEMKKVGITHLPGVPFHFQTMQRLRYERIQLPSLRSMAQAGGHLNTQDREIAHQYMVQRSGRFYVMYGQTEAAPRITTLAHDDFYNAPSSVGPAIDGGRLEIMNPDAEGAGDVVYYGPNVMMGYAEKRDDLNLGDELGGRLLTGDIGKIDGSGRLTLVGRSKRFGKVYGLRVNLDEIEKLVSSITDAAVVQRAENIEVHFVSPHADDQQSKIQTTMLDLLKKTYTLPFSVYRFHPVASIPRTERGKIDYRILESIS